ncbi:unnamed protein product, partial [Vitis vinifera]|uniref:Uncharacterized protein n=1 Tax=Vitis vinifera TaxID=29760 RepID=D7TUX7_VITVI
MVTFVSHCFDVHEWSLIIEVYEVCRAIFELYLGLLMQKHTFSIGYRNIIRFKNTKRMVDIN